MLGKLILITIMASASFADCWQYGIADDGTVTGFAACADIGPDIEFVGASRTIHSDAPPDALADAFGPFCDEMRVRRWKVDGDVFRGRDAAAIAADRAKVEDEGR